MILSRALLLATSVAALYSTTYAHCPNFCNGHGRCIGPNKCECFDAWEGGDCSIRTFHQFPQAVELDSAILSQENALLEMHGRILQCQEITPTKYLSAPRAANATTKQARARACLDTKALPAAEVSACRGFTVPRVPYIYCSDLSRRLQRPRAVPHNEVARPKNASWPRTILLRRPVGLKHDSWMRM